MKKDTPVKDGIRAGVFIDENGCWRWTKSKHSGGYGVTYLAGKNVYVHRLAYEAWVGPIPDGLQIDHLCRVRDCCNPQHLEPVPQMVNWERGESEPAINAAKDRCPRDHLYDEANTWRHPRTGWRMCRECNRARSRARTRARAEALTHDGSVDSCGRPPPS